MNGLAYVPSGAGRGHPAPWLSRQGARRAGALGQPESMKVPSSARWYYTAHATIRALPPAAIKVPPAGGAPVHDAGALIRRLGPTIEPQQGGDR